MKYHAALSIALATSALACSAHRTSEATGEVVPRTDTTTVPADTITTRTRDDTLNLQRDTAVIRDTTTIFRDTTTGVYGDTTTRRVVRDTVILQPRDTSAIPPDTGR
ncbi:MAG TPA: hypothetical protein VFK04_03920 [Gemmatimonadaceae bacterium]|jgi:hypothetical protein|nr:hypothetical protein [Gemmatimonadaceae bacterium]